MGWIPSLCTRVRCSRVNGRALSPDVLSGPLPDGGDSVVIFVPTCLAGRQPLAHDTAAAAWQAGRFGSFDGFRISGGLPRLLAFVLEGIGCRGAHNGKVGCFLLVRVNS